MSKATRAALSLAASMIMIDSRAAEPPAAVRSGWESGVPIESVVPAYIGDGLELAVIPTPRRVTYASALLEAGPAAVVVPEDYPHGAVLRELKALFPESDPVPAGQWKNAGGNGLLVCVGNAAVNPVAGRLLGELKANVSVEDDERLGREGYLLCATGLRGRAVAVLAGRTAAGDFWAVQTLKQLFARAGDRRYLRGAWMLDWPTFSARGSKELRNYMPEYKDNFSWGGRGPAVDRLVENFGWYVPYFAPGGELDCSTEAIDALAGQFAEHFRTRGVTHFGIKFDDVGAGLTDATRERFESYGPAIRWFMRELDKRAKALSPECSLYYLPQTYGARTGGRIAELILEAGGLPPDTALCWTGPQVFSKELDPDGLRRYMASFGLAHNKGLIYDNYARHGDFFPIPREGRSPELAQVLHGVFSENSTRLNRITRCDWNWNPEAYDPQRALKLACREASNRDPRTYASMHRFVTYYEANRTVPPALPRQEKIDNLLSVNARLEQLLADLTQVLPERDPMLQSLTKAVSVRLRKADKLVAAGYKEAVAARAPQAPVIDGSLDDACWTEAPLVTGFVHWDQPKWSSLRPQMATPIPEDRQTEARFLYDDANLYLAILCKSDDPAALRTTKPDGEPYWWAKKKSDGADAGGIWHGPSIELFLAPHENRMNYYQLVASITGAGYDSSIGQPASAWNSGWTVETEQRESSWTLEVAIPLRSLGLESVEKNDRWGLNICRTAPERQLWTFVWGPAGFHTPEDFGTLTFE